MSKVISLVLSHKNILYKTGQSIKKKILSFIRLVKRQVVVSRGPRSDDGLGRKRHLLWYDDDDDEVMLNVLGCWLTY